MKKQVPSLFLLSLLFSCQGNTSPSLSFSEEIPPLSSSEPLSLSHYHVEGEKIFDPNNKEFFIEGTNVGSLYNQEAWMTLNDSPDFLNTIHVLSSLYGKESCFDLLDIYQENYWTEEDFQNCQAIGLNTLRLPISYADVFDTDFATIYSDNITAAQIRNLKLTIREDHLKRIDAFIQKAKKYHLAVVLDLHGAFGTQNGNDHSIDSRNYDYLWDKGEVGKAFREKTLTTWKTLAERYKDETNILGFDLLNEPAGDDSSVDNTTTTGKVQWDYYDELYKTIRSIDPDHILIMESCWNGENLPSPGTYGWKNVVYEFHHYQWSNQDNDDYQYQSYVNKIANVKNQNFSLPLYFGEFRPFGSSENYGKILSLLKKENISYTSWTYKVLGQGDNNWGLYNMKNAERAHIQSVTDCDSMSEIERKWKNQRQSLVPNTSLIDAFKKNL